MPRVAPHNPYHSERSFGEPAMIRLFRIARVLVCVLTLALCAIGRADNWPQWRGPGYAGISKEAGFPTSWSETDGIVWKLRMPGQGSSTPAVWGDHIFLTSE